MKTVSVELIKARISELQTEVDRVKSSLVSLKDRSKGKVTAEDIQSIDMYTRELLTFKAGQSELIQLLQ